MYGLRQLPASKMRGMLALMQSGPTGFSSYNSTPGAAGALSANVTEVVVSRYRQMTPWMVGLAAALLAGPAVAQGNLDAGKTAAQIFSDTCATCHKSPGLVRRASASFLRSHYTTGSEEASSMARYLANVPADARPVAAPAQQKKDARPKDTPSEPTTAARQAEPKEQAKGSASRRTSSAEAKSAAAAASAAAPPEIKPPEPPAEAPPPALEPFEE
jgi:hypothetical protein